MIQRYTLSGRPIIENPRLIEYSEGEVVLYIDHLADRKFLTDELAEKQKYILELEAALKGKDKDIERLSLDLSANATMLARQCDMAREAERELLACQRELATLATGNLEAQHRAAKENTKLREQIVTLTEKYREIENNYVQQGAIYEGISDILRDGNTSDFILSFPLVARIADLRERACCLPLNEWGHTKDCNREQIATLKEREKILIARLHTHGDIETNKEEALRGEEMKNG